jgi:riboflavin synthase
MFTGLVEGVGELVERSPAEGGFRLRIATPLASDLVPGDSLAVNGVCLTIVRRDRDTVDAEIGPETVRVTTLGRLAPGSTVNLERPLRADSRLGGHFVQGHVDAIGGIEERRTAADFEWLKVSYPAPLASYLIPKGSIAVDGISLTVARLAAGAFEVQIVPYTIDHTNLRLAKAGDPVNLECDMIGKYVVRAAELAGLSVSAIRTGDVRP